ncbi:MAG: small-conductance mechanosensitive channel [Cryomorphaceae bacterium]|jgi:small-conductance mechanosensitive channel
MKKAALSTFYILLILSFATASAQTTQSKDTIESAEVAQERIEVEPEVIPKTSIERLQELEQAIRDEKLIIKGLRAKLGKPDQDPDLEATIADKQRDLNVVTRSFEQIATGGIGDDVYSNSENPLTWQEELTLVVKPLLENLRGLTEKPRKKEGLKRTIEEQTKVSKLSKDAIESIDQVLAKENTSRVDRQLKTVREKWQGNLREAERKRELALFELDHLNGNNIAWYDAVKISLSDFARDRGMTLLIAAVAALTIIYLFRLLSMLIELRRKSQKQKANRTTYRVIAYTQRLLTGLFVILAVLLVFFIRGDLLLLALSLVLVFGGALGLRHVLPQFVHESRLLLNIGSVRENERVVLDGIPWRVASINVFTKLINPEIRGVRRIPITSLKGMESRPLGTEKWFPSSIGDWVVDNSNALYEVIEQTPDLVELQSAQGTNKIVPTGTYYSSGFVNLTKSKRVRIVSRFGLDYALQAIALDEVPEKLQLEIQNYLEGRQLGTTDIKTRVEFEKAGDSSLDYVIIVQVGSAAASQYYRVERYIQQACVKTCNQQGWTIPFPQMAIHQDKDSGSIKND